MSDLTNALERILTWLGQHYPEAVQELLPGLPFYEIEEKLNNLPFRLPTEVYQLYQSCNGTSGTRIRFVYHWFLNLNAALETLAFHNEGFNAPEVLKLRENEEEPLYLFPIFDFDGEYFAVPGRDVSTAAEPVYHIGCDDFSLSLAFTSLTNMMLAIAECYETGVYSVAPRRDRTVVLDQVKFGEIRRKYNPEAVTSLYAEGW